jgi:hypothetical protein
VAAELPVILDNAGVALRHTLLRVPFELSAVAVAGFRAYLDGVGFTEGPHPEDRRDGDRTGTYPSYQTLSTTVWRGCDALSRRRA